MFLRIKMEMLSQKNLKKLKGKESIEYNNTFNIIVEIQ